MITARICKHQPAGYTQQPCLLLHFGFQTLGGHMQAKPYVLRFVTGKSCKAPQREIDALAVLVLVGIKYPEAPAQVILPRKEGFPGSDPAAGSSAG